MAEAQSPQAAPPDGGILTPTLCWVFAILMFGGALILRTDWFIPAGREQSISPQRAVFFVANWGTLTGFPTTISLESLHPRTRWLALGLMLSGASLSWIVGGALVARALGLSIGTRHTAAAMGVMLLLAALAGLVNGASGSLFDSVFNAISAVTNCGTWLGAAPTTPALLGVFLPLAVVGGLGTTVWVELYRWSMTRRVSRHARLTLLMLAGVYLAGFAGVFFSEAMCGAVRPDTAIGAITDASVHSLNARSAGLPFEQLGSMNRPTQWIVACLMLVGSGAGGAAGGIGVTTLAVLAIGISQALRGGSSGRVFGIAACWGLGYIALIAGAFWLMVGLTPEQSADRSFILAVSAAGNVGLSNDVLAAADDSAYVLAATMIAGRILPLLVLAWLARRPGEAEVVPT